MNHVKLKKIENWKKKILKLHYINPKGKFILLSQEQKKKNIKEKKLKIALYKSQREIHTVAARAAPGDLGLKSHPKDYQQKLIY